MNSEMTSKERVLLALDHKETDRVPFSLGFGINLSAKENLMQYMKMNCIKKVDDYLLSFSDLRWVDPEYIGPTNRNIQNTDSTQVDIWGIQRKPVNYGNGHYDEISYYPLKDITDISELDKYEWPSSDWFNVESLNRKIRDLNTQNDYAIMISNGNIFETSWYMRGFEKMLMDIIVNQELAWEILTRVTNFFIAYFKKQLEAANGLIDIVFTADDIGHQQGLLMSLELWEKMIKPHHIRLNKVLHEYGVKVMYHTDGSVMEAVPGLIDMKIDILEALQFDANGMDPVKLKECYGDMLCFHGGVSVQKTLPYGNPCKVKEEVIERIRVLGKNGGYILAPSHAVQAGTPPENIIAFLEASR